MLLIFLPLPNPPTLRTLLFVLFKILLGQGYMRIFQRKQPELSQLVLIKKILENCCFVQTQCRVYYPIGLFYHIWITRPRERHSVYEMII